MKVTLAISTCLLILIKLFLAVTALAVPSQLTNEDVGQLETTGNDVNEPDAVADEVFYDRSTVVYDVYFGSNVTLLCHVKSTYQLIIWTSHPNNQEGVGVPEAATPTAGVSTKLVQNVSSTVAYSCLAGNLIAKRFIIKVHRCVSLPDDSIIEEENLKDKLLQLSAQLLAAKNFNAYKNLSDSNQTGIAPEATGHIIEGLDFLKFIFTESPASNCTKVTLSNPKVRFLGLNAACVSYRLLILNGEVRGVRVLQFDETRIWQKINGSWLNVHFHRSSI